MVPGDHGSTFAGGPLVCHAAQYVVDRVRQPEFLAGTRMLLLSLHVLACGSTVSRPADLTCAAAAVTARGNQLVTGLRTALAGNAHVKEVRGSGLLVGIQLDMQAGPVVEVRPC